ncbi:MAG: alpha/beta hydrolase [Bacteroidota bacterium]
MKKYSLLFLLITLFASCKKEVDFSLKQNANEQFYLKDGRSNMPVKVQGNTASKVFILVIHGGPGGEAITTYNGDITAELKKRYGVVFWDQRNAGNTQGAKGEKLSVSTYVNDLEKLIFLLKNKYGDDNKYFLYGHSWGGMLTSSYLIKGDNQKNIAGWIEVDGVHNWPLNDVLTRNMIDSIGTIEMANNRNANDWKEMVDFCRKLKLPTDLINSSKLNKYAFKAETLMKDSIAQEAGFQFGNRSMANISSSFAHSTFMGFNSGLFNELTVATNSPQLAKITVPSVFLWGRYDFVVPQGMMVDAFYTVNSTYKEAWTFTYSGHSPMYNQTKVFNETVINFIEKVR